MREPEDCTSVVVLAMVVVLAIGGGKGVACRGRWAW